MGAGSGRGLNFGYTRGSFPIGQNNVESLRFEGVPRIEQTNNKTLNPLGGPYKIESTKQGRHIPNSGNYIKGRSILTVSIEEAQELVYRFAGRGNPIGSNNTKERIDFKKVIGLYRKKNGEYEETTRGILHYSKRGCHIVPSAPLEDNNDK